MHKQPQKINKKKFRGVGILRFESREAEAAAAKGEFIPELSPVEGLNVSPPGHDGQEIFVGFLHRRNLPDYARADLLRAMQQDEPVYPAVIVWDSVLEVHANHPAGILDLLESKRNHINLRALRPEVDAYLRQILLELEEPILTDPDRALWRQLPERPEIISGLVYNPILGSPVIAFPAQHEETGEEVIAVATATRSNIDAIVLPGRETMEIAMPQTLPTFDSLKAMKVNEEHLREIGVIPQWVAETPIGGWAKPGKGVSAGV